MAVNKHNVTLEIPKGVSANMQNGEITIKGLKGEVKRKFENPRLEIKVEGEKILILCKSEKEVAKDKMAANSFAAHFVNAFKGVVEMYNAKVKVFSGHFPITATLEGGNIIVIKNFLGEKVPRKVKLMAGVKVIVAGDTITIEGVDKDAVAQSAAKIENLTRITNKDRRIFQDGCYIIEKAGGKKI